MFIAVILSCKKSLYDRQGPIYKIGVYTPKGALENRPPGFRIRPVHNDLTKDSTSRNFVDTEVNTQLLEYYTLHVQFKLLFMLGYAMKV